MGNICFEFEETPFGRMDFLPSQVGFLDDVVFVQVHLAPFNDDLTLPQDRLVCSNEQLIYLDPPPFSCTPGRETAVSAAGEVLRSNAIL